MNTTTTASRIHPLMAGAAISVTVLCLVGAASIAGILPNSRANVPAVPADVAAMTPTNAAALAAPVAAPVVAQAAPAPAPAPVVHKRVVHHTQVAQARPAYRDNNDGYRDTAYREPVRQQQPVPAPAQPNYVGIGTGAVIGGLIGNQVGGGRGKALATVAGVIGGGMLGNAVQNQVQQQPQQ
ncbi:glycine zipper 2TM domain-containing protein [Janthinobacterium sp. FW305-129]|uniref:glycine zipper 2TM domain-containing protein n=1 Tax=Janthinobacterium sp. FW305-129 TaxID=2775054 RepID=UPI001E315C33|nr:glycine zipper 2TM domain-containing protein [Janthinobacterium sp. FW305-129]MCC7597568.1 glycine zipper 2TM domain-containing protein [Janthinobacterium sp. FW305-129]